MILLGNNSLFGRLFGGKAAELAADAVKEVQLELPIATEPLHVESTFLKTVGWVTAGFGAVALGLFVGREIRQRYKFNRRTPYDFYAHSGDEMQDVEFSVGI